jgi:histone-lysine N-methyltransferase SETD3
VLRPCGSFARSFSLQELIELVPRELWGAKLALKLLYERYRGEESSYAPYIANLPVGFPGVPIFYGKDDLDALEYPPVSSQVIKRCRWLVEFSAMEDVQRLGRELFGYDVGDMLSPNMLGLVLNSADRRSLSSPELTHSRSALWARIRCSLFAVRCSTVGRSLR